jgi:hypothetical protein
MSFNDAIRRVSEVIPPFNDHALRGFIRDEIDASPEFPVTVFKEGFKLIPADLELVSHTILSPEDRVRFELSAISDKDRRPKIPLTTSHLSLVRYKIRFGEHYIYPHLYTPYLFHDMLHISDKQSIPRKIILEKTFSRISDGGKNGLSVSPIRTHLIFNRAVTERIESYTTGEVYRHFLVMARLFHGKPKHKKPCDTTITHYMLAKFGFLSTLRKFGLTKEDISFTTTVDKEDTHYEYFAARAIENATEGPGLFLKVRKILLDEDQSLKFVVNLIYVLRFFRMQTIDNVYDEDGAIWRVILGLILYADRDLGKAYQNAETHLRSVDHFIDPITQKRFHDFGVHITDIYDLLKYIFVEIDRFMTKNLPQDLYNTRLDVSNGLLVKSFATGIFNNHLYHLVTRTNITKQEIEMNLRLKAMMFKNATTQRKDDSENYIAPPTIITDNFLLSGGLDKIRMGGRPDHRIHPSMLVVESINAFVGKYIGKTGHINPYVPTNALGAVQHPEYAASIDALAVSIPS